MATKSSKEAQSTSFGLAPSTGYQVHYQFAASSPAKVVRLHTLKSLLQRYKDILWEEGSHKNNVNSFVLELDDLLKGQEFSVFDTEMFDHLTASLRARGNSNATINRKMAALSKLLRKAFKMGDIHSLPEFRRQKERSGRIRFLEHDEEDRLFAAIRSRSELYYRFCIFLVDTGARFGEGVGLRWNDVLDGRATFWITKSGRSRSVPLTARARAALGTEKRGLGPFVSVDKQQFRAVWIAAKEASGFGGDKDLVPHALRHTCASRLVRGGIDIRRVQMWLGHQTLQMTMRYAHLASHDLDVCVSVLERKKDRPNAEGD